MCRAAHRPYSSSPGEGNYSNAAGLFRYCLCRRLIPLQILRTPIFFFFFFNDTATTEIYTLSLHDALPISSQLTVALELDGKVQELPMSMVRNLAFEADRGLRRRAYEAELEGWKRVAHHARSEEHTSELQSHLNLVCRLLLEKKKNRRQSHAYVTIARNVMAESRERDTGL